MRAKNVIGWISAGIIAFLLANIVCFFYYNPLHGSTHNSYRLEPDMIGLDAREGFGILYSDRNGFPNKDIPLIDKGYILCMGSSFTKGDQVLIEDRWPSIINEVYGDSDFLHVYNMGYNGGKLGDVIKNFKQLTEEFPDSRAVIIEIDDSTMSWTDAEYLNAIDQMGVSDIVIGPELKSHDTVEKIELFVKTYCPLLLLYYNQLTQYIDRVEFSPFFKTTEEISNSVINENIADKEAQYKNALDLVKNQYEGEVIIIYHPRVHFTKGDTLVIEKTEQAAIFEKICAEKKITFLDMTYEFQEAFENEYILPYGFWNTSMGDGHFNKNGNRLMAKKILDFLQLEEK